jgi:hydroxyacylglutathione hydrolase
MSTMKEYVPEAAHEVLKSDHSIAFADIRPELQFNDAHVVGAINVPYNEETYPQTAKKLLSDEKSVILIGVDPLTVDKAAKILRESGFSVHGFLDWRKWEDERFPSAALSEVTAQQMNKQFQKDKKTVLIDVRNPEEWEKEHISNARNIPLHELEKTIQELEPDQEIVTICGIGGGRSAAAYSILKRHGFQNAKLLKGGLHAWKNENLPVVEG